MAMLAFLLDFLGPGRPPRGLLLITSVNKYLLNADRMLGSSECSDPARTDSEAPRPAVRVLQSQLVPLLLWDVPPGLR